MPTSSPPAASCKNVLFPGCQIRMVVGIKPSIFDLIVIAAKRTKPSTSPISMAGNQSLAIHVSTSVPFLPHRRLLWHSRSRSALPAEALHVLQFPPPESTHGEGVIFINPSKAHPFHPLESIAHCIDMPFPAMWRDKGSHISPVRSDQRSDRL